MLLISWLAQLAVHLAVWTGSSEHQGSVVGVYTASKRALDQEMPDLACQHTVGISATQYINIFHVTLTLLFSICVDTFSFNFFPT